MATTVAVVEVQPAIENLRLSSPLAGMARRRFGGKTLLQWMIRRVSDAHTVSSVVVLAGEDALSNSICAHPPADVRVFRSPSSEPLGRLADLARAVGDAGLVRLNVCHPLVDPDLVDRLVNAAEGADCDYAGYCLADGRPVSRSRLGVCAEWVDPAAVLRAERLATSDTERCDSTLAIVHHPESFTLKMLPIPVQLDRDDLRLAIRDEEDWEDVQLIVDALGPESLDWQYIASLVDRQPALRARMAERNRQEAGAC